MSPRAVLALAARLPGKGSDVRWLGLLLAARLLAAVFAVLLLLVSGLRDLEAELVVAALAWGMVSAAIIWWGTTIRSSPAWWVADGTVCLGLVVLSGDWRSPFYLLWLTALALPAVSVRLRRVPPLAVLASGSFLAVATAGGPVPGSLGPVASETLAIHLVLPAGLICGLAYAADALRRLDAERAQRERLAIEAERRRIAFELHDSAKQRVHAAHLLASSLRGGVDPSLEASLEQTVTELESASADMDTSVAELRSPLEGRPLADALRARADELALAGGVRITVRGHAPELPPLHLAHAFRVGAEALSNAIRHADASRIVVTLEQELGRFALRVTDDGKGLPATTRTGATGLLAMESRAATIGGRLTVGERAGARGTCVLLEIPIEKETTP